MLKENISGVAWTVVLRVAAQMPTVVSSIMDAAVFVVHAGASNLRCSPMLNQNNG